MLSAKYDVLARVIQRNRLDKALLQPLENEPLPSSLCGGWWGGKYVKILVVSAIYPGGLMSFMNVRAANGTWENMVSWS